jgi:hypothetical protein
MVVFIVSGRGVSCMDNSTKKSKKFVLPLIVILSLTIAAGIFLLLKNNKSVPFNDEANKKVLDQMSKDQVAPSGINPSDLTKVNALINEGKDAEAKKILDNLKNASGLQQYDRLNIYSSLAGVCKRLKDRSCLKEVIIFNQENNRVDVYLLIDVAQLEKNNNPDQSRDYYAQAKKYIDENGGQSYVEKLNASNEVSINYDEVINGSR